MKTLKLMMLAATLMFATIGYSQATLPANASKKPGPSFSATISLKAAIQKSDLLSAIYAQVTPAILNVEKPMYVIPVKVGKVVYYVSGTYNEWAWFFSVSIKPPKKDA